MEDKIIKELKDPQGRCWLTVPTSRDRWLFEELAQDVTTRELMLMPEVTEPQLAWDRLLQHRLVGMWLIQPNYRGIMQEPVGLLLTEPDSISCEALDRNLSVAVLPKHRQHGYGRLAVGLLTKHLLSCGYRVSAVVRPDNNASQRLFAGCAGYEAWGLKPGIARNPENGMMLDAYYYRCERWP